MPLTSLQYRVLEISYKNRLSHIGSCLGCVDILDEIYTKRKPDEPVILSCGHAGLSLYVMLEKYSGKDAEQLFLKHGVHPNKDIGDGIYCSTGSLGMGISIATGRALANRNRNVWCVISDGEMLEGVVTESLNFARKNKLYNLRVYCNINGFGAYHEIDIDESALALKRLLSWSMIYNGRIDWMGNPFLRGQDAHYYVMNENDWKWVEANK